MQLAHNKDHTSGRFILFSNIYALDGRIMPEYLSSDRNSTARICSANNRSNMNHMCEYFAILHLPANGSPFLYVQKNYGIKSSHKLI